MARIGDFELVYPSTSCHFIRFIRSPLYSNLLLSFWQKMSKEEKLLKMRQIKQFCANGLHIAKYSNKWEFLEENNEENSLIKKEEKNDSQ